MLHTRQTSLGISEYFGQLRSDTHVFASIGFILEKIERDKNLKTLGELFKEIFAKEIAYAIEGKLTRAQKGQPQHAEERIGESTEQ